MNTMVNQGEDGQASKSATVGLRLMYYICTCVLYIQTSSMLHVTGPLKSKGSVRGGIAIEGENCAVSYGSHSTPVQNELSHRSQSDHAAILSAAPHGRFRAWSSVLRRYGPYGSLSVTSFVPLGHSGRCHLARLPEREM